MLGMIIPPVILCMWALVLTVHTQRLLRLAQFRASALRHTAELRQRLARVRWCLGREEFQGAMLGDCWRCAQLTIMLLLLLWGATA